MKKMQYIGYSLMVIAYTIFLIKNLNVLFGLVISISTIIIVLIILKYFSVNAKEYNTETEEKDSYKQSIGNGAKANSIIYKNNKQIINTNPYLKDKK